MRSRRPDIQVGIKIKLSEKAPKLEIVQQSFHQSLASCEFSEGCSEPELEVGL
jgi:hypothetical protein